MSDNTPSTISGWEAAAESRGIPPGPGRGAWVLAQWAGSIDGQPLRFRSLASYRCRDCGRDGDEHGPVEVMVPSDTAPPPAGGLVGPLCPGCAISRLRGGYG